MANCKNDFLEEVGDKQLLCAVVEYGREYWNEGEKKKSILAVDFTPSEYVKFLQAIDYRYDSGYGGQEVYGTIWYRDGTWSEREEYDGSEWWEHKSCPAIPEELQTVSLPAKTTETNEQK